nr:hypothetical protein [Caballeronia sp. SL2Y3]
MPESATLSSSASSRPSGAHHDLAGVREFERVAEQVVENLRDANRIEQQLRRTRPVDHDKEPQALPIGERRVRGHHAHDERAYGAPFFREPHFADIHLREVEDIVDHLQKRARRCLHRVNARFLFGGERPERDQLEVADER